MLQATLGGLGLLGFLALALVVPGHRMAGVSRSVEVVSLPAHACVVGALHDLPAVSVGPEYVLPDHVAWRLPTFKRVEHVGADVIVYSRGDAGGELHLRHASGTASVLLEMHSTTYSVGDPHKAYPPARIARIRETLDEVYAAVATRCGPLPPAAVVREIVH